MRNGSSREYSYNAQAVADDKCQIIVSSTLNNREIDYYNLKASIDGILENTGRKPCELLADAGYFSGESLFEAAQRDQPVLINIPAGVGKLLATKTGIVNKEDFIYDAQQDCFLCPYGQSLYFERIKINTKRSKIVRQYRCKNFKECPHHKSCSKDKRGRTVERGAYDDDIKEQVEKQSDGSCKKILARRKTIIEPVFGWLKFNRKFNMFSYRGIKSAQAQWSLMCTMINLNRLYQKWMKSGPAKSIWKNMLDIKIGRGQFYQLAS